MVELDNVTFSHGAGDVFRGVSLNLAPGSFHFLTGPSGSGKTTLMNLCYGALAPHSGTVKVLGSDLSKRSRDQMAMLRRRIGVVHQSCEFLDHLPVTENIALPLLVTGKEFKRIEPDIQELVSWVGLTDRAQALPDELSGGERQRAALARAVIMSPDLILADEPTGNVDWDMSQRLLALLTELNRMGKTVLLATHDLSLVRAAKSQVQARVLRIKDRKLIQAGATL